MIRGFIQSLVVLKFIFILLNKDILRIFKMKHISICNENILNITNVYSSSLGAGASSDLRRGGKPHFHN